MTRKRILAILMLVLIAASVVLSILSPRSETTETAARRVYDPNDTTIYVPDQLIPLSDAAGSGFNKAKAYALYNEVNNERQAAGLDTLEWNEDLYEAAMVRAQELPQAFSHTRPNGLGWYTVNGNIMYGENLARGYDEAPECSQALMDSPTHRDNILADDFLSCGVAAYEVDGYMYWSQEFGY